jgi:glycosyltransferase involved in cell wall biosynthesis
VGGDRLRIWQICRYLSREFELSLLSLCATDEEMEQPLPGEGIFSRVERVRHTRWARSAGLAGALAGSLPMQVGYYRNAAFARKLHDMIPGHDVAFAHLVRTVEFLFPYRLPRIVEMTDAISLAYTRAAEHMTGLGSLAYRAEARRLRRFEKRAIHACDRTVLVSAVDRDSLDLGEDAQRVLVCSNGVDAASLPFEYAPDGRTIVFIGKNLFRPNVDAITHFAQVLLPAVRARVPRARFKVVGEIRGELAERLRNQGIEVTGRVESIREATRGASAGVCPVRFGAGVQNKLLEYMALGIPAVTSPIGLEGLGAIPGRHIAVASAPEEWADLIASFLRNSERGLAFATAARRFVEECHSWEAHLSPLCSAVWQIAQRGTQSPNSNIAASQTSRSGSLPNSSFNAGANGNE